MVKTRLTLCAAAAFFIFLASGAAATNISVPLELVSRGFMDGGVFAIESYGKMALSLDGGYKFGGRIILEYLNDFLEQNPLGTSLAFGGVSITAKDLFDLPANASWFVGEGDIFCEGEEMGTAFGTAPISTSYKGFSVFPEGTIYMGIHQANGTGLKLDYKVDPQALILSFYLYEDLNFITPTLMADGTTRTVLQPGYYSADLLMLANLGAVQLEAFLGGTYGPTTPFGNYRGGILFYVKGEGIELYSQIGIPKCDPATEPAFGFNLFYLLFEPRLHIGIFSLIPTFFWHPGSYLQRPTGESSSFDVNLETSLGDLTENGCRGGLESNFRYTSSTSSFRLTESPFVSFVTMGIVWTLQASVNIVWPLTANEFSGLIEFAATF
jgi:hypothetical protein